MHEPNGRDTAGGGVGLLLLATLLVALPVAVAQLAEEGAAPEPTPRDYPHVDPGARVSTPVEHAIAVLHPTRGHEARGTARFATSRDGLTVHADARGLAPNGVHALHVHLYGDCSARDGSSAGTHFNFRGSSQRPPPDVDRITGNLGEFEADAEGEAALSRFLRHADLHVPGSVIGRAVIIHADGNDAAKPPLGGAGAAIACGVIGIARGPQAMD